MVSPPDIHAIATRAASTHGASELIQDLGSLAITNAEQELMAAGMIASLAQHVGQWEADIEGPLKQARDVVSWIQHVYPIKEARAAIVRLKGRIQEYRAEQERQLALTLPLAANPQEIQQLVAAVAATPPGLRSVDRWTAEPLETPQQTFADLRRIAARLNDPELTAVLDRALDPRYLTVDAAALNERARALKTSFDVRGARAVCTPTIARKG